MVAKTGIIIYGGTDLNGATIYGDIAVLDTVTWQWLSFSTINTPPGRYCHTATLVGANMIVAFGDYYIHYILCYIVLYHIML